MMTTAAAAAALSEGRNYKPLTSTFSVYPSFVHGAAMNNSLNSKPTTDVAGYSSYVKCL